jgi:dolichyl-phosphate-mannose-protein mannosyltransferase
VARTGGPALVAEPRTSRPALDSTIARGYRWGWLGPLLAAGVAAVLRLWDLGRPHAFVFDETYYAKQALGLVRYGTEQATVENADEILLATRPSVDSADVFLDAPQYVVHPPLGKWLIGLGELALGVEPTGWRWAAAIASVLSVLLLGRIVLRLTGSALLATLAAGILALDGLHLVVARTALLDGFLMLLVLAAFGALLIDRDATRTRYRLLGVPDSWAFTRGWRWIRGWRLAAGVLLGLACGVKWSALWYVAAFGVLTVVWEVRSRRSAGRVHPWRSMLRYDALPAFAAIVGVGAVTYLATWTGWIITDSGWGRDWRPEEGAGWIPQWAAALWHYHGQMLSFHVGLDQEHPYESSPWGWLLQARPTSFYYEGDLTGCGATRCSAAVLAVGTPPIWWAGVVALLHQTYRAIAVRDWRSGAVVVAVAAGWVPWLIFPDRTTFSFYTVVLVPFLVAALTMSLGTMLGTAPDRLPPVRAALVGGLLLAIVVSAWWLYPIWTAQEIPFPAWQDRMWLPSWV